MIALHFQEWWIRYQAGAAGLVDHCPIGAEEAAPGCRGAGGDRRAPTWC